MRERFAIVDGKKAEATPKAKGICPHCESEMIAECGRVKVWQWAHKGNPHSTLKPEERISREEFYKEMLWVVDGNIGELDENYFNMGISGPLQKSPLAYAQNPPKIGGTGKTFVRLKMAPSVIGLKYNKSEGKFDFILNSISILKSMSIPLQKSFKETLHRARR
jgi:hypothetical protein